MSTRSIAIKKISRPNTEFINKALPGFHYSDTFSGALSADSNHSIERVAELFFNSSPEWARKLLYLRNRLVGCCGLKIRDIPLNKELEINLIIGERVGLFKLYDFTDDELLFGEDDKHLDVRIIIQRTTQSIQLTTLIQFKNAWGKLYFNIIRIFHQQIIKSQLRNLITQMNYDEHRKG
ncbi:hypothetical protein Lqui_0087 [Legionella quinlivanii]|uniref:DUF2867 domain-containing protein n=1 Tax=Legionella quinlivanii TaxID=45073 RepID=A0A0W0Y704_9GAMM|nr:DUF2867 domain-containing protein [Legionella quinlivanii]KTD52634.1 hypothetical protein Lqui_0087 [Legionella quinlivanii]MCW8451484.1 DUF2867 domain-containing protein [Legionella quinlivanii]SEG25927.1 Protein of unknown function [Legionella quinlivanii DSM 21216]STY10314.1 Protein of uncharacterised function (DUF2867) [Legionella quinlivanii]